MNKLSLNFIIENTIDNITKGYISESTIDGFGLFAKNDINIGDILCILDGQVVAFDKYYKIKDNISPMIDKPYCKYIFEEWNVLDEDTLLVRSLRTKYSYINHSKFPNTKIIYHPIRVIATKYISKGEEILIDYRKEPLNKKYINSIGEYLYE